MTLPQLTPGFTPADDLEDAFFGGQINESQFMERGIEAGMTLEAITDFILMVRLEDGTVG